MSDILSQEEVDALLSAVSAGDFCGAEAAPAAEPAAAGGGAPAEEPEVERSVKIYDFRRPDRVSKDQMRTLQNLHEGYARLFSTTLTSYLRTLVEIELISVDQLTYSEFMMSISNPSCIYIFDIEPLEGSAIFEINPSLVFFIVDRLFGGQGAPTEQNRELTEIERSVLNKIIERALVDLKEVWEHVGIFSPKIQGYETNPQFVQIAPPGETVILISLEVRLKNGSGLISICYPFMLLESVMGKLSGESWISSQRTSTQETRRLIEKEISSTNTRVAAVIGQTNLTVRDLLQLQPGDVVVLDKLASSDLVVQVGTKPKFLGKVGVVGNNKCIQVTSILDREVGEDE
ncbi:MAG: flagellar motor switch protein FliM [Gemmatimonadales bacterium]|nr:MAG: flagellar motor switch protein FliM [Gemmatimonadales bacterium]